MTAFYELHMEQGATFVVPMKIVKTDGDLFRFIPPAANFNNGTKLNFWWRNFNTTPILNFDIKQQLEEISANNKSKMGIVNFIALKQPRADSEDIHLYLESLYVRIVDNAA